MSVPTTQLLSPLQSQVYDSFDSSDKSETPKKRHQHTARHSMPMMISVPDLALPFIAKAEPKSPSMTSSEEDKIQPESGVGSGRNFTFASCNESDGYGDVPSEREQVKCERVKTQGSFAKLLVP